MKKLIVFLVACITTVSVAAQEKSAPVTISGVLFGDYYYVAQHHDDSIEGKNGFWIRRGYVTFDRNLSEDLSARLRFEVNQPGDFKSNTTMQPFVKDAYVKWRQSPKLDLLLGMSPSPSLETVEKVWGYRAVERVPLDLYRFFASRDLGVAAVGSFDTAKRFRYHAMVGNGASTGSETNSGKRVAAAFDFVPSKDFIFEIYGDTEDRPGNTDRTTFQGFAGITRERFHGGVTYAHQIRDGEDLDLDVASIFGAVDVRPNVSVLARIDRTFDAIPDGDKVAYLPFDPTSKITLFIAGVDWRVHKNINFIPNVEYVRYEDGRSDDVMPRLTFNVTF